MLTAQMLHSVATRDYGCPVTKVMHVYIITAQRETSKQNTYKNKIDHKKKLADFLYKNLVRPSLCATMSSHCKGQKNFYT